ncbi:MAG: DNA repair protein RecN [Bacteroidota bacterium]|nr:DNA repair protein RecN [Bacteroidota bacterium]
MITSLTVSQFALIEHIEVDLAPGLTVVTGETGAGKSILVDALSLVLGERADTTMVRDGAAKAVVEAQLESSGLAILRPLLESFGAEWRPDMILRREVPTRGSSRCFINDTPVPLSALKTLGDRIVDLHGQHEHQSLLRQEVHIGILDAFARNEKLLARYREAFDAFRERLRRLNDAYAARESLEERRAVITYQLREIDGIGPKAGEDEDIERQLRIAEHAERFTMLGREMLGILYDEEGNVTDRLGRARRLLINLSTIDSTLAALDTEFLSATAAVEEIVRSVRNAVERMEFDPARIEELRARSAALSTLKRRFRATLPELIDRRAALVEELEGLENIDASIADLERSVEEARAQASEYAAALHEARCRAAELLAPAVVEALAGLGIPRAQFSARVEYLAGDGTSREMMLRPESVDIPANENGCDTVAFFLSTNVGEELKPLVKVASGGEVSRIMLALKSIFAETSPIPVMVFDEIDTGVSGSVASKVGRVMLRLARSRQVIAITHLPQIAAFGDTHLLVEKTAGKERTRTSVRPLNGEERVREIARLLSGDRVTPAAMKSAAELLHSCM